MKLSEIEKAIDIKRGEISKMEKETSAYLKQITIAQHSINHIGVGINSKRADILKLEKQKSAQVYSDDQYQVGYKIQIPTSTVNKYNRDKFYRSVDRKIKDGSEIEIIKRTPKMFRIKLEVTENKWGSWGNTNNEYLSIERRITFRVFSELLREIHGEGWKSDLHTKKRDESIDDLINA